MMTAVAEFLSEVSRNVLHQIERFVSVVWHTPLLWLFLGVVALAIILGGSRKKLP